MTKVITRYFETVETAKHVRKELMLVWRFSEKIIHLHHDADTLQADLSKHGVKPATITAYKKHLTDGGAVMLVEAGFKPLRVAQITRDVTAAMGAVDLGRTVQEVEIADPLPQYNSILSDHPLILSGARRGQSSDKFMANWPLPLISRRKPFSGSAFPRHARMADIILPLISKRKPADNFAFPRHARMANKLLPLLSKRKPSDKFAFARHARMANFPIPLLSKRKPNTASLIPRHGRMATWPIPLLITEDAHSSAIIPDGPRMASFPIPLLSKRKPSDSFAFSRHARMANFPISLLSKRKPSDKFAFPRHARMADKILPLVIRRSADAGAKTAGFLSRPGFFGIPTIVSR